MYFCRTGRLSAAAVDQALKSVRSSLTTTLRDDTVTLRKGYTVHRGLCAPVRGVCSTPVRFWKHQPDPQKQKQQPAHNWDTQSGFVISDWAHLDRVSAVAVSLSRSVQTRGGFPDLIRQPNKRSVSKGGPAGNALFTGNSGVSVGTMQTRSASTAAAAKKKSEAGEEQTADNNKEVEQNLKDTSTTSSSAAKAQEEPEPEPEGGKPTKAQQLKKVFKEYGAVGVSFHIGISLMSLGMFYLLISSGIDMAALLCKVGFSEAVVQSKMAAGTSTFVLAYAIHKLFAPVRISITLVSVPLIVRYFRKTGLFKPPTPAP
ncbi:protein FAM210B%2C mitochondrial [Xyrichtys novacula]|uniref:Protein FAM210B, mitochondrial n=1 Tax=Xyrichtys novacula TaxID=13765 RepID=A0AAV1ENV9_XYRNO|nr:protein FAM210B%2C mitochondrial [Xyrichtys novacula]